MASQTSARRQVRRVHDTSGSISDTRASQSASRGPESVVSGVGEPRLIPRATAPASTRRYASPTRSIVSSASPTSTSQHPPNSATAHLSYPPPSPNVRTGFPQYQRFEAAAPLLSRSGPPAYPDFLSLQETALLQLQYAFAGLKDAFRWDHVIQMAMSDQEIRANVVKSLVLNSLSLVSIYIFDWVILPLLHRRRSPDSLTNTHSTYQLLWLFPVVGVSLYLNSSWCALIGRKAYNIKFGRHHATGATTYSGLLHSIASSAYRIILIGTSMVLSFALAYVPLIGKPLAFLFVCWVDRYIWQAQGMSLSARVRYLEERWAYFLLFGMPSTALCLFGNSLANAALFGLSFPAYIMMAMHAQPSPVHPYNPVPPIAKPNGDTSYPIPSPFIPIRLPVFKIVIMLNELVIKLIDIGVRGKRPRPSARSRKSLGSEMEGIESGMQLDGMESRARPSADRPALGPRPQVRGTKLRVD